MSEIEDARKGFEVTSATYSEDGKSFRPINLPFFAGDGAFVVNFTTNREEVRLNFFANDCILYVNVNGRAVSGGQCTPCKHCAGISGKGEYVPGRENTMTVVTKNLDGIPYFIVEDSKNHVVWSFLAVASALLLAATIYCLAAGRKVGDQVSRIMSFLKSEKALVSLLALSFAIQLLITPYGQSRDVTFWMVRAEDFIHKEGFDYMVLDPDYSYSQAYHMGKPPGAYLYLFAATRVIFGFSHVYLQQLTKLPAVLGCLLVGWILSRRLREKFKDRRVHLVGSALFVLNPAVLVQTAYLGKHDALTIALVMLALDHVKDRKFPLFYGLGLLGKQFTAFMIPYLVIQKKSFNGVLLSALVFAVLSAPFLLDDAGLYAARLVSTHTEKAARDLSWMTNLAFLGEGTLLAVSKVFLITYLVLLPALAFTVSIHPYLAAAVTYMLFVVFSKVVFEQYVLWSLPFLIFAYFHIRKTSCLAAFVVGSVSCMIWSEDFHLLNGQAINAWNIVLSGTYLYASYDLVKDSFCIDDAVKRLQDLLAEIKALIGNR